MHTGKAPVEAKPPTGCALAPFSTVVRLVDYAGFTAESGMAPPSPLDPDAGFQGWRLP